MIKIFIIAGLLYAAFKIYKPLALPKNNQENDNDQEYTDYEEIDEND